MSESEPSARTLLVYSLPVTGASVLEFLFLVYFLKFSTDVLLVAPAVIGTVLLLSRVWDAVSDPTVGFLSDRTTSAFGRRRTWLRWAVVPIALAPVIAWAPPRSLSGTALVAWLTGGLLLWTTANTMFRIPHEALGVELTPSHHGRTRVFAYRAVCWAIGYFIMSAAVQLLETTPDPRTAVIWIVASLSLATALLLAFAVRRLREPSRHQGLGAKSPLRALHDFWRNPHARLLLFIQLVETFGSGSLVMLGPFYLEYVFGDPSLIFAWLMSALVAMMLFPVLAVPLTRRFGKKRSWMGLICFVVVAHLGFIPAAGGSVFLLFLCTVIIGAAAGNGETVARSVRADVIDWDEYSTGERKEGMYFAVWHFVQKAGGGIAGWFAGIGLQWAGYEPDVEQSETVINTILVLFAVLPALGYLLGLALLARLRLTETEHKRIRAAIDARSLNARTEPSA